MKYTNGIHLIIDGELSQMYGFAIGAGDNRYWFDYPKEEIFYS